MLGGDGISKQCRTADIMADAAYAILTKPTEYTGNFVVDEDLLKQEGIRDFDHYAVEPGTASSTDDSVWAYSALQLAYWLLFLRITLSVH